MPIFGDLFGKALGLFTKQLTMDIKISVPSTPDGHDVPVRIWYLATKGKLDDRHKTIALIKGHKEAVALDADRNNPVERSSITIPADAYLYIVAEPKGEWDKLYKITEIKEEKIRTGKANNFILALERIDATTPPSPPGATGKFKL
jgi:hypothetical protein